MLCSPPSVSGGEGEEGSSGAGSRRQRAPTGRQQPGLGAAVSPGRERLPLCLSSGDAVPGKPVLNTGTTDGAGWWGTYSLACLQSPLP